MQVDHSYIKYLPNARAFLAIDKANDQNYWQFATGDRITRSVISYAPLLTLFNGPATTTKLLLTVIPAAFGVIGEVVRSVPRDGYYTASVVNYAQRMAKCAHFGTEQTPTQSGNAGMRNGLLRNGWGWAAFTLVGIASTIGSLGFALWRCDWDNNGIDAARALQETGKVPPRKDLVQYFGVAFETLFRPYADQYITQTEKMEAQILIATRLTKPPFRIRSLFIPLA